MWSHWERTALTPMSEASTPTMNRWLGSRGTGGEQGLQMGESCSALLVHWNSLRVDVRYVKVVTTLL